MNPEIIYLIKVNLGIALFYAFYKLFFHKDTFFIWRRVALLTFLGISLFYPLLNLQTWLSTQVPVQRLADIYSVYLPEITVLPDGVEAAGAGATPMMSQILLYLYGAVVMLLFLRFFVQLFSIIKLAKTSARTRQMGVAFYRLSASVGSFSFFKWIFIHPESFSQAQVEEILTHESTHANQWHSLDILFYEIATICCWFNPFVWLMRREVRNNLEFLADQHVLDKGFDSQTYQYHLLGLAYPQRKEVATLYNSFNVLPLKIRIQMMNKRRTKQIGRTKYLMFVPLVAILLMVNNIETIARDANTLFSVDQSNAYRYTAKVVDAKGNPIEGAKVSLTETEPRIQVATDNKGVFMIDSPQKGQMILVIHAGAAMAVPVEKYTKDMSLQLGKTGETSQGEPYMVIEEMPQFPGGIDALLEYLRTNIKYPKESEDKQIQGRVVVKFVIDKEGNVTQPVVVRSVDSLLDEEALRVVSTMPKWTPGKIKGEVVAVFYTIPINFSLKKSTSASSKK